MDVLIEKNSQSLRLSEIGLYRIEFSDSASQLSANRRTVKGRSGFIYDGATFTQKSMKITDRIEVSSMSAYLLKQDELNAIFMDDEPFYITKMIPEQADLYGFELPGQAVGDVLKATRIYIPWHYRYKVIADHVPEFEFLGKAGNSLKYKVSFSLITAELPFGETRPSILSVTNKTIGYNGTAPLSQLEWPFVVELVSDNSRNSFFLEMDGHRFEYSHSTNYPSGTKFLITGMETTMNKDNVTDRTNYEYFVLNPNPKKQIKLQTNFSGSIRLLNFVELYK